MGGRQAVRADMPDKTAISWRPQRAPDKSPKEHSMPGSCLLNPSGMSKGVTNASLIQHAGLGARLSETAVNKRAKVLFP